MSGAADIVKNTLNPIKHVKNTYDSLAAGDIKQAVLDPGNVWSQGDVADAEDAEAAEAAADEATLEAEAEAQEDTQTAAKNAARTAKRKKTAESVLTSPLGTTTTAATAVTKLGGK